MNQRKLWRNAGGLIAILAYLLSPLAMTNSAAAYRVSAQSIGNTITLDTVTTASGTTGTFAIRLDNSDAVASGQLRFTSAAGLGITIDGVQVTDRTTGFASIGTSYATGDANLVGYQILFYNLSQLTITPGTGGDSDCYLYNSEHGQWQYSPTIYPGNFSQCRGTTTLCDTSRRLIDNPGRNTDTNGHTDQHRYACN